MSKKLLFLTPYPHSTAPSQRFRFEQYFHALMENKMQYKTASFLDLKTWQILYLPGKVIPKVLGIVNGFLRRFLLLVTISKYDYIFIHREASPIGPPIFEWLIAKILRKKIIYDFDDAIWIPNTSKQNKIAGSIKWHHKVSSICKWSYKVSVGNNYLRDYAKQFNRNVIVNPTTIDTEFVHNTIKEHVDLFNADVSVKQSFNKHKASVGENENDDKLQEKNTIIGWTGSHSTLSYINEIVPVLKELEEEYNIEFQVISNQNPQLPLKNFRFIKWKKDTEIEDLSKFDIGLMPLTNDKWAKGKCGFKALQYMALGIPSLVSPVGVNTEIVEHEINGFICYNLSDWKAYLVMLIKDAKLRSMIGKAARNTIEERYSVKSNTSNFLNLFK